MNIAKSLRTKSTKGKSLAFLMVIELGYVAGITHKIPVSYTHLDVYKRQRPEALCISPT